MSMAEADCGDPPVLLIMGGGAQLIAALVTRAGC
jgi:hypothetical protein